MHTTNTISFICGDGALAIAFTVFVMLTLLLAAFVALIFLFKPFRKFLFHKDYEPTTETTEVTDTTEPVAGSDAPTDAQPEPPTEQIKQPTDKPKRRSRARKAAALDYIVSVPTVPLGYVSQTDTTAQTPARKTKRNDRRKTETDDVRTIEFDTPDYDADQGSDRTRYVTNTPRKTRSKSKSKGE